MYSRGMPTIADYLAMKAVASVVRTKMQKIKTDLLLSAGWKTRQEKVSYRRHVVDKWASPAGLEYWGLAPAFDVYWREVQRAEAKTPTQPCAACALEVVVGSTMGKAHAKCAKTGVRKQKPGRLEIPSKRSYKSRKPGPPGENKEIAS